MDSWGSTVVYYLAVAEAVYIYLLGMGTYMYKPCFSPSNEVWRAYL